MEREPIMPNPNENEQKPAKPAEKVLDSGLQEQTTDLLEGEPQERKVFLKTAQDFLIDGKIDEETLRLEDKELTKKLQAEFQENLERYFKESGLSDEIEILAVREKLQQAEVPLDEQALNLIARKSEGVHGWVDMLPNLRKQYKDSGMNCTMGSAMLHLALEKLGYSGVRTVLRKGHSVVFREIDDGSIQFYDPTSLSTVNEKLVGYSRKFTPDQITNRKEVEESENKKGFAVTLEIGEADKIGGFSEADEKGKYAEKFYAYDPSTKMDIAIALENLSEIKQDAEKLGTPESKPFSQEAYKTALADFVRQNNTRELSNEDIKRIGQENRQTIEELLQAAEKSFKGEAQPPNPFDFLQSDLLTPKAEIENIPDPKTFIGSSERYEQAKELCEKYPELKDLDFKTVKEKFGLFDGYEAHLLVK